MRTSSVVTLYLAGGAAALLAASGCGFGVSGGLGGDPDLPGAGAAEQIGATIGVVEDTEAGPVVSDSDGYTLYTHTRDTAEPSASICSDECAEQWPPALVRGGVTTDGVERSLVGRMKRADGGTQLTLSGWPLYRFSGDVDPGDVYGQGADGSWFAMTPSGTRADALPYGTEEGTGSPRDD
ncbi:COG4315 family predicted lipoprotein [Streptomonospora wellingtoniae]|uniref:Lipoprotein n=1 Tax=Streptomonospora wellingtoniae TaxID=3075544 RepID=A0ABU2KVI7_9ACTN|nr:hypothetical protein [Streptomonospora sp. DSM 45055]MDT0303187.1 hypothetical protein [Streptomonospora sp. DSM 45055]